MSAGGEVVGRISVQVVPELGLFRTQMDAAFEKYDELHVKVIVDDLAEAKAKLKDVAKDIKATVKTSADTTGLKEKIKADTSGIRAKVEVDVDDKVLNRFERRLAGAAENAVSKYEPNLNLTVQDEKLRRSIEEQLIELKGLANLPVSLDPEIATKDKLYIQAEFERLQAVLQAHADAQPIKLRVYTDMDQVKFGQQVDKFRKEQLEKEMAGRRAVSELNQALARADAEVNKERAQESARQLMITDPRFAVVDILDGKDLLLKYRADVDFASAEIDAIAFEERHKSFPVQAKIKPDADMGAFQRAKFGIEALFSNIRVKIKESKWTAADLLPANLLGGLDDAAKGLTKVGAGAASSLPSLFSFAGILGVVVAAIAILLPPLIALGVGLISLAPAFLALIAPAAAIALGLEGIKKAATDAGLFEDGNGDKKGGGTVGAALKNIKEAVSGEFAARLTEPFRQLGAIMPALQGPLVSVAAGLSEVVKGFIGAITGKQGLADIQTITENIGQGFREAAPGVQKFTEGILRLVAGISEKFPGLGKWITDLGNKFAESMVKFTTVPQDNGLTGLENLIANVRRGIEGLTGVFQAFWNQGLSDIQNPDFGKSMLKFFDGVRDFVTNTLPALSEGFKGFASFLDTLAPLFQGIGLLTNTAKFMLDPGGTINDAVARSKRAAEEGGSLWDQFKAGLFQVGPVQEAGRDAGELASQGFKDGMLGGGGFFAGGSDITTAINDQLQSVTTASVDSQKAALRSAFSGTGVTDAVKGQIGTQLNGVISEVQTQLSVLGPALDTAVNTALTPLQGIGGKVTSSFAGVTDGIAGAFALVVLAIGTQANNVTNTVAQAFTRVPSAVSTGLAGLGGAVTTGFGPAKEAVTTAVDGMVTEVTNGGPKAAAAVSGWTPLIVGAAAGLQGAMFASGAAVGASFASGLSSMSGVVGAAAGGLMGAARELFPNSPAKTGPFSGSGWVDKSGEAVADGFASGINDGMSRVVAIARQLMQAIKDVFGSAEGLTLNFNFGGAATQMGDLASNAKTYSSNLNTLNNTGVKPAKIDAATQATIDGMKQENAAIDTQVAQLREQKFAVDKAGKAALDAQIAELQARKANITSTLKQTEYQAKYGDEAQQNKLYEGMGQKITDGISNVGQGVLSSFTSDLGISGDGALQGLAQYGMQLGNKYIFNVNSMEEAQAAQQRQQTVDSLSYAG